MIKENLSYRIELVNPKDEYESDRFARDFAHSFGLKTYSGTWSSIDLDSPVINDFILRSKELINHEIARFDGYCTLTQHLEDTNDIEWYELRAKNSLPVEDYDEIITCRADKMSPNVHVSHGWSYNIYISEKFKTVVEENKLTGLDFLWVKDIGRFQAAQWYVPIALNPLGRGIDHPWFNPTTLKGSSSNQPTEPEFRCGTNSFNVSQIKKDNVYENDIQRDIISLFDPEILSIISYRRFLRVFIPDTDFAFIWHSADEERKRGDYGIFLQEKDMLLKQRGLCISKRAKDVLISNRMITSNDLEPIKIYDSIPDGIDLLDGKASLPTPFYSYSHIDLDSLKIKIEKEWEKFCTKQKQVKKITLKDALNYLTEAKKSRGDDFCKPLSKNELGKSNLFLPEYWIEVLKKTNGGFLNIGCELKSLKDLEVYNRDMQNYCEEVEEDYPRNLIHIASSISGDWYSLKLSSDSANDSKVLRVSHETCEPIEEWDSIATFIYDMLSGY